MPDPSVTFNEDVFHGPERGGDRATQQVRPVSPAGTNDSRSARSPSRSPSPPAPVRERAAAHHATGHSEHDGIVIAERLVPRRYFHWRAPLLMLIFYLIGISMCAAHCAVYSGLSGEVVGSPAEQEKNLR